ncbi:dihydropteroate synthase [Conexibacter sp. DBS9H8]|uniref:dihydropteroate synthase n=1 Tax=Conexibacter sp. DBS9H8 TaxID=2937801 RepID=UPI00200CF0B1|nr:dihydropteroate synthase [Conexibacter sp. DBS9H8]
MSEPEARVGAPFTVMGIVNVTPDSFSDGGSYLDPEAAIAHGLALVGEGAAILDVGGESTRPGADPVPEAEETTRVIPVIEGLAAALTAVPAPVRISVDTSKFGVAAAAFAAGATLLNDVTALRHAPELAGLAAQAGAQVCLVHMRGEPRTMQASPVYGDVVSEVKAFLEARLAFTVAEGVPEERVILDPGIGFGKTVAHNLTLLRRCDELLSLGRPILIGTSRKSFLGALTGGRPPADRLAATIATNVIAYERGARIFRVHDVAPVHDALTVTAATFAPD